MPPMAEPMNGVPQIIAWSITRGVPPLVPGKIMASAAEK